MHPWTRVDRWGDGGDASRRYLYTPVSITQADNECRLEGDKTHEIFHFLSKKVGGGTFPMWSPPSWKVGGGRIGRYLEMILSTVINFFLTLSYLSSANTFCVGEEIHKDEPITECSVDSQVTPYDLWQQPGELVCCECISNNLY